MPYDSDWPNDMAPHTYGAPATWNRMRRAPFGS
jgi:hypothetical protein